MFRPKKLPEFSFIRTSKKFLNDRESFQRIKHLRSIIDNVSNQELKGFFQKYFSLIFHAFYEVFSSVQLELLQKVNSTHYKELQNILSVLEKILLILPEIIKRKWQFNCICGIIKTLLHPTNIFKVRLRGMRLFFIWFQILNKDAPRVCYDIYIGLLPVFEPIIKRKIYEDSMTTSDRKSLTVVSEDQLTIGEPEIKPVLTQNIDKEIEPSDENQFLLRYMLRYMITEGIRIDWIEDIEMKHNESYSFLFEKFKEFFLPVLFPKCDPDYTLESNARRSIIQINELESYSLVLPKYPVDVSIIAIYQDEVLRWLSELVYNRRSTVISLDTNSRESSADTKEGTVNSRFYQNQNKVFTIESYLIRFDGEGLDININMLKKMQNILFGSPENVNIVNQLLQHAFYLPIQMNKSHFAAIFVYKSWLFYPQPPSFMLEKCVSDHVDESQFSHHQSTSFGVNLRESCNLNDSVNDQQDKMRICPTMQRLIFTNVATIFLHTQTYFQSLNSIVSNKKQNSQLQIHSELARKIIEHIYRPSVNIIANLDSEHLMKVLLNIGLSVFTHFSPSNRPVHHWIANDASIAQFFQTLNVLLIRSNLVSYISAELWNRYLTVYSSLTHWPSLISEWRKTIELLVKMLAKHLYGLDMNDLPLEKTERRKHLNDKRSTLQRSQNKHLVGDNLLTSKPMPNAVPNSTKTNCKNTMNYNSSGVQSFDGESDSRFMDKLQHNSDDLASPDQYVADRDSKNEEQGNEIDGDSISSSHEDNSSYISAEESSSPQYKDMDHKSCYISDNEHVPLSSSGGDTSLEGNGSYELSFRPSRDTDDGVDHVNVDADDECEDDAILASCVTMGSVGMTGSVACNKSGTLTRDGSDIDLPTAVTSTQTLSVDESSKTPTKSSTNRRKLHTTKRVERHSMNIEESMGNVFGDNSMKRALSIDDVHAPPHHHVILGGSIVGWSGESVVILWRRCLGLLGNVTQFTDIDNQQLVFEFFYEMTETFLKMRQNMCVSNRNQPTSRPPIFVPPIEDIIPWLFEICQNDAQPLKLKVLSLKILCKITIRKHDIEPCIDHLCQFYRLIHNIIQNENKFLIVSLVTFIGNHFYSQPLAGSEVIIFDLVKAAELIIKSINKNLTSSKQIENIKMPKIEALSLLNNILKIQSTYKNIKVFDANSKDIQVIDAVFNKKKIVEIFTYCAKNDFELQPRILSIISLTLYCYAEILNPETGSFSLNEIRQCILQILSFTRVDSCKVAAISIEMVRVLIECAPQILEKLPHIPEKIIQVLSWTIATMWQSKQFLLNSDLKRIFTSLIFTLVDWCMVLPLPQLLDDNDLHPQGLVHLAFSALEMVLSTSSVSMFVYKDTSDNNKQHKCATAKGSKTNLLTDPLFEYPHLFDIKDIQDTSKTSTERTSYAEVYKIIRLSARTGLCHLINFIGQFPRNEIIGSLSSCVQEHNDFCEYKMKSVYDSSDSKDISAQIFESQDVQLFVVNGSMLVSLLAINSQNCQLKELQNQSAPGGPPISKQQLDSRDTEVRVIIRDLCGKYCWDVKFISKIESNDTIAIATTPAEENVIPPSPPPRRNLPIVSLSEKSGMVKQQSVHSHIYDNLEKLFEDLMEKSFELFSMPPVRVSSQDSPQHNLELLAKQQILDQNTIELKTFETHYCQKISHPKIVDKKIRSAIPFEHCSSPGYPSNIYYCRQILTQLGFLSWKRRSTIDIINKSNIFLHLKALDQRRSRETHKIAVLYVKWGQEDKESVLGNTIASLEFNNFISGIGWPVNLESHRGFLGGLDPAGRNGSFSPYYSNSMLEVMFHVSTWMISEREEDNDSKFKHLGNDDVMIIWSENYRDYQSNVAKTQFGDVMIIIYPLRNGLFSVTTKCKKETRLFGPLFDGAIVEERELPSLVRTTAINAGRAIREYKQHYQEYYHERAQYLDSAIKKFKMNMSFEDFAENLYGNNSPNQDDLPGLSHLDVSPSNYSLDQNKVSQKTTEVGEWTNNREMRR